MTEGSQMMYSDGELFGDLVPEDGVIWILETLLVAPFITYVILTFVIFFFAFLIPILAFTI